MAFKDRIKEARLSNKFTQEQLAEKIGVAKSHLLAMRVVIVSPIWKLP